MTPPGVARSLLACAFVAWVSSGQDTRPAAESRPTAGSLDVRWIHGCKDPKDCADPPIQVHRYEASTWIFRQSKAVHFEAPFLYLLVGSKRALLVDTGATASDKQFPIRDAVEKALAETLRPKARSSIELVVAHSHAHGDHVAGDGQFKDQPSTTVVAHSPKAVASYFAIERWPEQIVSFDLGDRRLEIVPIPGHQASSIAVYDPRTGLLLTGDTLYPGRLYVADWPAFRASIARLSSFAASRPVTHVLGAHVEMSSKPGVDYPMGARFQPSEHPLQLSPRHLEELHRACEKLGDSPARDVHDSFIIWPK